MGTQMKSEFAVLTDDSCRDGTADVPELQWPPLPRVCGYGAGNQTWHLHEFAEVSSTNLIAAKLPAWHAVRADTQTAGRGRFQRHWVSDAGGLWLSAVVPVETNTAAWRMLPLVTGVAVCDALRVLGARGLRLRWPNDVLMGNRKLAGLLIDQFHPGRAVVGIGLNVTNQPEECDTQLAGQVIRLTELVSAPPTPGELAERILISLRKVWQLALDDAPAHLLPRINALWDLPRRVAVDLDGPIVRGQFLGVDAAGRLLLRDATGQKQAFEPQGVRLLRDLD